jgi:hypothetical protein
MKYSCNEELEQRTNDKVKKNQQDKHTVHD